MTVHANDVLPVHQRLVLTNGRCRCGRRRAAAAAALAPLVLTALPGALVLAAAEGVLVLVVIVAAAVLRAAALRAPLDSCGVGLLAFVPFLATLLAAVLLVVSPAVCGCRSATCNGISKQLLAPSNDICNIWHFIADELLATSSEAFCKVWYCRNLFPNEVLASSCQICKIWNSTHPVTDRTCGS